MSRVERSRFGGAIWLFLAELLLLPTGLLTAAFLTRQLNPEGYGALTLTATFIGWIEWSITSVFTRTTIKFVGETEDWRSVAAPVLRLHLGIGLGAMLGVWVLAVPIAAVLKAPEIPFYLRLFAIDLPFFCLAYAHRSILVGIGSVTQRAIATAGRWISRAILIVLLVQLGLSLTGAILGNIGASIVELILCRCYIRPSLWHHAPFPMRRLWGYAIPLFLFALTMRLYEKLDLFALQSLSGQVAQAGFYGAAQNLALIPSIFSLSFTPLLLSTLTRTLFQGDSIAAKQCAADGMRVVLWMIPIIGLVAGASTEIVTFVFGAAFLPTAPLLTILIGGSIALAMISTTTAILTAAGKPNWTIGLAAPLLPLAFLGYSRWIPQHGVIGAATVMTTVASLGAVLTVGAVYRLWQILPPLATLCRSLLVCGVIYAVSSAWKTVGFWLLIKLSAIAVWIPLGFLILGEFNADERAIVLYRVTETLKNFRVVRR